MQETVTFELVRYEVKSRVAEITLNRPPVNAINVQLANEVVAAYRLAKEDSAVRAVILASGLPEVYSAGVDLKLARSFDGQFTSRHFTTNNTNYSIGWESRSLRQ